jgi:nucleoporin NDC1
MSTWNNDRPGITSALSNKQPTVNRLHTRQSTITSLKNDNNHTKPIPIKSYESIYNEVFNNRMKFYYRLSAIVALLVTLIISIPFKSSLIFYPIKFLLLWFGFFILQQARILTTTTESSNASNYIQNIIYIFSSRKCYILFSAFFINSFYVSLIIFFQSDSSLNYIIKTPTKTIKPFVNDNFSFFCFFTIASSIFHSLNFLFQQKFKLNIPIGTYRQEPIDYLKRLNYLNILFSSILKSLIIFLTIPLIYHIFFRNLFFKIVLKPLVILLDLNNQLPRSDFNFSTLFIIWFYSWILFLSIDILNECFNAYALVGCLVIQKPISYFSETPLLTLLSGLKNHKNSLVRLTAFQELTYLSTSKDFKDRSIFYRADNWTLVLSEFYFILINAAKSARSDLPKIKSNDILRKERIEKLKKQSSIFGSLNKYDNNKLNFDFDFDFDFRIDDLKNPEKSNEKESNINDDDGVDKNDHDVTIIKKDNTEIFNKHELKEKISTFDSNYKLLIKSTLEYLIKLYETFEKRVNNYFQLDSNYYLKNLNNNNNNNNNNNSIRYQFLTLYFDILKFSRNLIFGTIQEQSNKRIPNKEIVGFSIISLTEMLIHSKIEDKSNIVTNTLTEVLTLLTKVYKGTYEFLNNPPTEFIETDEFSIKIINELALSYFFKLVIYYNSILNDLLLPPEVFKLAKWCTDMALEQQKEQQLKTDILQ